MLLSSVVVVVVGLVTVAVVVGLVTVVVVSVTDAVALVLLLLSVVWLGTIFGVVCG